MSGVPDQAGDLAAALEQSRARTLALMEAWCQASPELRVPQLPTLNLPLWEWGHVGWFQTWWVGRNRQRALGLGCNPEHERSAPARADADELYNSSTVPHARRWSLDLPGVDVVRAELSRGLEETLQCLEQAGRQGHDLYCWQLVLVHEDMHQEAVLYMAQALKLPIVVPMDATAQLGDLAPRCEFSLTASPVRRAVVSAQTWVMGQQAVPGRFCFDNECGPHEHHLGTFEIDLQAVSWGQYLPFLQATGYPAPAHLRCVSGQWKVRQWGVWHPLNTHSAAAYLSAADAQAWCDWAGRALPTEAQWECAALTAPGFEWGQVWEWTASPFKPYPGFTPHPYRDYSVPWFGTHRVLRGASALTAARLRSPRYRNFFLPERQDVPAGFRTVGRTP